MADFYALLESKKTDLSFLEMTESDLKMMLSEVRKYKVVEMNKAKDIIEREKRGKSNGNE